MEKPAIHGLMKASTVPRRRHVARRRERRRSSAGAPETECWTAEVNSGNLRASSRGELVVDLLVEAGQSPLEVADLPCLVLRHESVHEILVRAPDEGDGRRSRFRITEDVEEDVE